MVENMKSKIIFSYDCPDQKRQAFILEELIWQEKYNEVIRYFSEKLVVESDRDEIFLQGADPEIFREAAYYYAAWLEIAEDRHDLVVEYISQIPLTISGDIGLCSYPEFRKNTSMLYEQLSMQHNKPAVLIAAMPKSASSYLSSIVSTLIDMPIVRVTFGQFPKLVVIPDWLKILRQFGGVTHDHLLPTSWTLECIMAAGISDVFVQYRDPRAAAWSAYMQHPEQPEIERFFFALKWFNEWLDGWIKIRDAEPPFRLHFINYDEVRNNPEQVLGLILQVTGYNVAEEMLSVIIDKAAKEKYNYNFRSGNPNEWREMLPYKQVAILDTRSMLTPRVRKFIGDRSGLYEWLHLIKRITLSLK